MKKMQALVTSWRLAARFQTVCGWQDRSSFKEAPRSKYVALSRGRPGFSGHSRFGLKRRLCVWWSARLEGWVCLTLLGVRWGH